MLCREFVRLGHEVRLATLTPGAGADNFPFPVIRQPGLGQFLQLLRWSDIHLQANVSLKFALPLLLARHRLLYLHGVAYAGDDGTLSLQDRLKRIVARHTPGVACSNYVAATVECQWAIGNPYDDATFRSRTDWLQREGDIVFLGRLVSQKGCDVLVRALGELASRGLCPRLTVIGEGASRAEMEALASEAGVSAQIRFAGVLRGEALAAELNRHRILAVPSSYREPFGIVALEGLACGCLPIVSREGGLVEAVGPNGASFPNGDHVALAARIEDVLADPSRAVDMLRDAPRHLEAFHAANVATRYLEVMTKVADRTGRAASLSVDDGLGSL